jgi:hypothetical protein
MAWKTFNAYPDYSFNHLGKIKNIKTGKILKGTLNDENYQRISLYRNGTKRSFYIHRIIAFLFVPNPKPDEYFEVHHINGRRHDNRSSNLQWLNHNMNMKFVYIKHRADYRHKNEQQAINLQYI